MKQLLSIIIMLCLFVVGSTKALADDATGGNTKDSGTFNVLYQTFWNGALYRYVDDQVISKNTKSSDVSNPAIDISGMQQGKDTLQGKNIRYIKESVKTGFKHIWHEESIDSVQSHKDDYSEDNSITFKIPANYGYTLTPTNISFTAGKSGTGDPVSIRVNVSTGDVNKVVADIDLQRINGGIKSNDTSFDYHYNISGIEAISDTLYVTFYVKGKGFRKGKDLQLGVLTISGTYKAQDPKSIETTSEISVNDLDIINNMNCNPSHGGIDRENVGGFKFEFGGEDATKSFRDKNGARIDFRYKAGKAPGTITISSVDDLKIKKIEITTNKRVGIRETNGIKKIIVIDGYGTMGILNDTITTFYADSTGATSVTLKHNAINADDNISIKDFKITTYGKPKVTAFTPTIAFDKKSITLNADETAKFNVTTIPANLNGITYTSANPSVATVDNGNVVAQKGDATTTICATYTPSNSKYFNTATAEMTVNINPADPTKGFRNISIADLDYDRAVSSDKSSLDRTTRGLTMKFSGGDGVKYDGNGGITWSVNNTAKGVITVGFDEDAAGTAKPKITQIVLSTNNSKLNVKDFTITSDVAGTGSFETQKDYVGRATNGKGDLYIFTPKEPAENIKLTLDKVSRDNASLTIANIFVAYSNGPLADKPCAPKPGTNNKITVTLSNGKATFNVPTPKTTVANLGGKGRWTYAAEKNSGITIKGNTATATKAGSFTLTAKYTPTNAEVIAPLTSGETFTIVVRPARTHNVWVFDKELSADKTTGIGHRDDFEASDAKANWGVSTEDANEYQYNVKIQGTPQPLLLSGDDKYVDQTEDLYFTSEEAGNISLAKDKYLNMDESGTITINSVDAGSYLLVWAESTNSNKISGFRISGASNLDFYDENLSYSKTKQVFMFKTNYAKGTKSIMIQPIDDINIYKIEVTKKKAPVINVTTTLKKDANVKEYQVNNGANIPVTFNMADSDVKGTLTIYLSDNSIASTADGKDVVVNVNKGKAGSASINAKANNLGMAKFIARFTPADDETAYTYGYASFSVSVSDGSVFRLGYGEQPETGSVITSVPNITMTFGGWTDAGKGTYGKADTWKATQHEAYVETFSGFDYGSSASENAGFEDAKQYKNPFMAAYDGEEYWYKDKENNPYHMPTFGGYLKFLPEKNGTLTVYIHQNGAICQTTHKNGSLVFNPYKIHVRSYYIGDETGHLYTAADGVTAETLAYADEVWNGKKGKKNSGISEAFGKMTDDLKLANDSDDVTNYADENLRYQGDYNFFANTDNGGYGYNTSKPTSKQHQEVKCLKGGWVMLNEGATKYTIPVKAGKTYFFFTNRTKLGFYGFQFEPDDKADIAAEKIQTLNLPAETSTEPFNVKLEEGKTYYKIDPGFKKTLNYGQWNGVCLPFSMTEEQTKEAFGEGAEILDFEKVENNTITFRMHYYQMIVAGRPYAVFIPKGSHNVGDEFTMKVPSGLVSTSAEALSGPINVTSNGYTWTGNYRKLGKSTEVTEEGAYLPKNAYFWKIKPTSAQIVTQNQSGKSTLRGYRAYLIAADGNTEAKALKLSLDGIEENTTTGIDNILTDFTDPQTNGKVYNLNGQTVSQKGLNGLPGGIYIMNGKKYVIK